MFGGIAGNAYSSMRCFEEGARSLALAGEASREALRAAGANADALQRMTNADYQGAAAGVLSEIEEIAADLSAGNAQGNAFGKWINRAAAENDAAWSALDQGKASSKQVFSAVNALIGAGLFLDEAFAFNGRVIAAALALENEVDSLGEQADDAEWRATGALAVLDKEKLWLVGENAFQLVGSGATLSAQYNVVSFEDDLNSISRGIDDAQRKQKRCASARSAKAQGWASDCVLWLRNATALLDEASLTAQDADSRSRLLEAALRDRVLDEQEKTRAAIDAVRESNPYAAAAAQSALEKNYDSLAQSLATRGERISFYLREIALLRDLQDAARASPFAREEKSALLARLAAFKKTLAYAEADGLNVEFEKREAAAVEAAVEKLDEGMKSTASIVVLKESLSRLEEGVFAQALERYGELLAGEREEIAGVYEALTDKQKILFDSYENFFDAFGRLRARSALGSLKKMRDDYESLIEYAELRLPELLRKNLEDGAAVFSRVEDARLGAKALVRTRVELENKLPLSYDKQILVSVPAIASALAARDYSLVAKSPEVSDSPNGLYLSKVEEGGKYFFEFERNEQITRETSRAEETVYASRARAVKRTTIRFDASRAALVVVPLALPFAATLSAASSPQGVLQSTQTQSALGSSFAAVVEAAAGANEVAFEYEIDSPVSVSETRSFDEAKATQRFDLAFTAKTALDNAALDFSAQLGCEPKSVKIDSSLESEYATLRDSVEVWFKAKRMEVQTPYLAAITVQCDSLADAYAAKLAEVQQLAAKAELSVAMRVQAQDLIRAAQALAATDTEKALAKLYDAEEFITAEQERGAQDAAARAEYSDREASVLALIAQAENASLQLAARGFASESAKVAAAARDARSFVAEGRRLAENGDAAGGLQKLALAEDALRTKTGNAVRADVAALAAQCAAASGAGGDCGGEVWSALERATALASAGDYAGALEAEGEARASLESAAQSKKSGADAKKAILAGFTASRDSFDSASSAFNDAFSVPSDYERERSRSLDYQEGTLAKKDGDKRVAALGEAWTALETNDSTAFSKFSLSFLNDSASRLASDELTLREKTTLARANAEDALATANARQKQFGDETTRNALDSAQSALDAGNYYTAWLIADAVNKGFAGIGAAGGGGAGAGGVGGAGGAKTGGGILEPSGDSARWTLAIVGVLVLAALVYALVLKQKRNPHRGI
jgi:hypothetical protein